jgi:Ca-activated chloride channel family protein
MGDETQKAQIMDQRKPCGLRALCAAIIVLLIIVNGALSQETPNAGHIRIESALVTVPAVVSDLRGRFLPGLGVDSFRLYQDGVQVPISVFLTSKDPIKIALLLDTSASTQTVLGKIKKAAGRFLLQLRDKDVAMVASFSTDIQVLCPFSSDPEELGNAIKKARAGGGMTKMRDAIYEVIHKRFRSAAGRKAIVLLTDGQDHGSKISAQDLQDEISTTGISIYSVFYNVDPRELMKELTGISSRIPKTDSEQAKGPYADWRKSEERAAQYLEEISELSAGRLYRSEITKLDDAFKQVSDELRSQYLLGFYPDTSKLDGSIHALAVSVTAPQAVVRSRRSYRAAPQDEP